MSQPSLIIHQYRASPFSAKVRRALHYKGVPFSVVNYGIAGAAKIRKLNPTGKAPILEHGDRIIPDSTDILRYIEQCFPDKPLFPRDPALLAQAHVLEDWADESLYFYDLTMRCWPHNYDQLAEDLLLEDGPLLRRIFRPLIGKAILKQARAQGIGRKDHGTICREVGAHFQAIDAMVAGRDWLLEGADPTVADIAVVAMCSVLDRTEEGAAAMAALPGLMAWRERMDSISLPPATAPADRVMV